MRRFFVLLSLGCSSVALAGPVEWRISESAGQVHVSRNGIQKIGARGTTVAAGDTVTTGTASRAVLVRGTEYMMVAPATQLRLPEAQQLDGFTRVVEDFGNIVFMIKKKMTPHFEVKTPYLAAVVKGTTFSVGVTDTGAAVKVLEGAVDVATADGGAHDLITPGAVAMVGATNRFRMEIRSGGKTRVIQSKAEPATPEAPQVAITTRVAETDSTSAPSDIIAPAIQAPVISLADATGGLVVGNIGGELAIVSMATRVATEASTSAVKAVEVATISIEKLNAQQQVDALAAKTDADASAAAAVAAKAAADKAANESAQAAQRAVDAAEKAKADQARSAAENAASVAAATEAAKVAAAAAEAASKAEAERLAIAAASAAAAAQAAAAANMATDNQPAQIAAQAAAAAMAKDAADAATAAKAAQDAAAIQAALAAQQAAAQTAAQDAATAADNASKAVSDKAAKDAEKAAKDAQKAADKAADDAAKAAEKAAKDAVKTAADAAKAADDAAKSAAQKAIEAAQALLDKLTGKGKGK